MESRRALLALLAMLVAGGAAVLAKLQEPLGARMAHAAAAALASLPEELRTRATFEFDDPERINWHFIPRPRKGVPLRSMNDEQKERTRALLRTGTSSQGFETALGIMSLESILRELEDAQGTRRFDRDPELYYLSVFGKPGKTGRWGWRIEGHHLCLNYVIDEGRVTAMTPLFYGANPARVPSGPQQGRRTLPREEDLARTLYQSLEGPARKEATLAPQAPSDVLSGTQDPRPAKLPLEGLPAGRMSEGQRKLLVELLETYAARYPEEIGQQLLREVREAGLDRVHFGWAGPAEPGKGYYYRVQGPTFIIELNNTQNAANHIHSLWRSAVADLGIGN